MLTARKFMRGTALSAAFVMSSSIAVAQAQAEDVVDTAINNGNFKTMVTAVQAAD
jgi:hypothetical protein